MKILFVSRFLPHAQARDTGGQSVFHAIESLSAAHDISLISFTIPAEARAVSAMREICREVIEVPYQPDSLVARAWRAGWRLLLPKVYGRNVSLAYWRALRGNLRHAQYDVIYVDGMMAVYRPFLPKSSRILDEIDIYSQVAKQSYQNNRRPVPRLLSFLEYRRTLLLEIALARRFEGVVVRSYKDGRWLRRYAGIGSIYVVPPFLEGQKIYADIDSGRPPGNNLLFVGAMGHPKNIEAVTYFVNDVMPRIRQKQEDVHLYIVGANPVRAITQMGEAPWITVTGEVEDLKSYYERCAINVVPLLHGGGLIAKTLNGMAAGRPTVSTPLGNSGTGAKPGRDLIVVHGGAEAFAASVVELLKDEKRWRQISIAGRDFVTATFDWSQTMIGFEAFMRTI